MARLNDSIGVLLVMFVLMSGVSAFAYPVQKEVNLTGLLIVDGDEAVFHVNPFSRSVLAIKLKNADQVRSKLSKMLANKRKADRVVAAQRNQESKKYLVSLVDARVRITHAKDEQNAQGEAKEFKISRAKKAPVYGRRLELVRADRPMRK